VTREEVYSWLVGVLKFVRIGPGQDPPGRHQLTSTSTVSTPWMWSWSSRS
jgi:hypothetical protein